MIETVRSPLGLASQSSSSNSSSFASISSLSSSLTSSDVAAAESLKLVIVCVGLPARGKSYITKKLQRYFNWSQFNTKIFNVGNTRRLKHTGPSDYPVPGPMIGGGSTTAVSTTSVTPAVPTTTHSASFFDSSNEQSFKQREKWAKETLDRLLDYLLYEEGNVGIFDATNTTKERRRWIIETVNRRMKGSAKILFLESICTDAELIEKNIHLKLRGPDYKKMDRDLALQDFRNRLKNYEKVYETIDESEELENEKFGIQYVKIVNAGKKITSYNISGYLSSQCVFFLLNFNLSDRQIWLTTNGETQDNVNHIRGGDSSLSPEGWKFSRALSKFISRKRREFKLRQLNRQYVEEEEFSSFHNRTQASGERHFNVWTSTLKRSVETVEYFPPSEYRFKAFKMLDDMCYGEFDSTSEDEFRVNHFEEYQNMLENRLSYRFSGLGGESYLDVIARLRPIIIELERLKDHVLIVSHRSIIRVLLCYFMNLSKEMMTELDVQHGYVYCVEPKPYGLDLRIWQYDDVTEDFYEVDQAEFMQRKRKRIETPQVSEEPSLMDLHQYQKIFCGRSDSQCYEFAGEGGSGGDTTPPRRNMMVKGPTKGVQLPKMQNEDLDIRISKILADEQLVERLRRLLV
ncbi:DEKNAAC103738 [Brettanomyces naardenensis]|uniref:DEKNAAC103738 n=1 Tax=Brettanomyces naardenensis TaxID=13370 RepID=A0A448YP88_BRENA|nr:DEKNAAC103738 [Brettanomyces naardenensis]